MAQTVENLGQAINVLVQAVNIAQQKGAFTLKDSSAIQSALDFLESQSEESNSGPQGPTMIVDETKEASPDNIGE